MALISIDQVAMLGEGTDMQVWSLWVSVESRHTRPSYSAELSDAMK